MREATPAKLQALRDHLARGARGCHPGRRDRPHRTAAATSTCACAELMGNEVLAELLGELISRCCADHADVPDATVPPNTPAKSTRPSSSAMAAGDEALAVQLMNDPPVPRRGAA
ncbi:MAG: hypothetical protein MZW92_74475 [Comamonadaceae bacterium]|nr:hypothetical protein [Comamonadaceae bacterium]